MHNTSTDYVQCQANTSENYDRHGVVNMFNIDEAFNGLEEDGEGECHQEYTVEERACCNMLD